MPKYRFAWTNLPPDLLDCLARTLGLSGDPAHALRGRFGARPKAAFIQQAWPILLDVWLPNDSRSRQSLVHDLRESGLGKTGVDVGTLEGQLSYLRTCRNAPTLRDCVLRSFLAVGEEAQLSAPAVRSLPSGIHEPPPVPLEQAESDSRADRVTPEEVQAEADADLNDWVVATLMEAYDLPEIHRDEDGDISIPRGSSVLFINPHSEGSPFLRIFSPLLSGFTMSPEVHEAVNEINLQVTLAKAIVVGDGSTIVLGADLLVDTLSAREFLFAIDLVLAFADHFDTLLRKRFGGTTMMQDDEDSIDV